MALTTSLIWAFQPSTTRLLATSGVVERASPALIDCAHNPDTKISPDRKSPDSRTFRRDVDLYSKLVSRLGKGVKMAAVLDRLGKTEEIKEVEKKNEEIATQAGALRNQIQKKWTKRVQSLTLFRID